MSKETTNEERESKLQKILKWNNETINKYRKKIKIVLPGITIKKIKDMKEFAATINGDLDKKFEAVKEKFSEEFEKINKK